MWYYLWPFPGGDVLYSSFSGAFASPVPSRLRFVGGLQAARQTAESRVRILEDSLKGSGRQHEETKAAEARALEEATATAKEKVRAASSVGFGILLTSIAPWIDVPASPPQLSNLLILHVSLFPRPQHRLLSLLTSNETPWSIGNPCWGAIRLAK